jgi:hypothetical protein
MRSCRPAEGADGRLGSAKRTFETAFDIVKHQRQSAINQTLPNQGNSFSLQP